MRPLFLLSLNPNISTALMALLSSRTAYFSSLLDLNLVDLRPCSHGRDCPRRGNVEESSPSGAGMCLLGPPILSPACSLLRSYEL